MSALTQLYQLQQVDSEREAARRRLAEVLAELGESQDLVRARESVGEAKDELGRLHKQVRSLELELGGLDADLKANQEQLYGKERDHRELRNLEKQAASLRSRYAQLEDRQLDVMIQIEELTAELAERQARLGQIEGTWREEQTVLLAAKDRLEVELSDLEEKRDDLRHQISASNLALYDELYRNLGGVAVAVLKQGICQACGVDVPTGMARAVERGEEFQFCPVCDRLLCSGG